MPSIAPRRHDDTRLFSRCRNSSKSTSLSDYNSFLLAGVQSCTSTMFARQVIIAVVMTDTASCTIGIALHPESNPRWLNRPGLGDHLQQSETVTGMAIQLVSATLISLAVECVLYGASRMLQNELAYRLDLNFRSLCGFVYNQCSGASPSPEDEWRFK